MRTLFLNPPSYEGFDGGAGSRYQARREIRSFWYPPADGLSLDQVARMAAGFELCVIHTSTPSFRNDLKVVETLRGSHAGLRIGLVGAHVAVLPEESLSASKAVDFVAREEFDYTLKEIAEGRPLALKVALPR